MVTLQVRQGSLSWTPALGRCWGLTLQLGEAPEVNLSHPLLCHCDRHGHARASGRCSAREMFSAVVISLDTSVSGGKMEPELRTGGEEKNDIGRVSELSWYEFCETVLIYAVRGSNALRDHQMKSAI